MSKTREIVREDLSDKSQNQKRTLAKSLFSQLFSKGRTLKESTSLGKKREEDFN
jgi:hypothetical protein